MNTRGRHPWVIAAMLFALTGCAASGGALQSAVPAAGVNGSWMDPATTGQNLLYVSDEGHAVVDVFVYPLGKAAGMLTDVHDPVGLCSNKAGKVWVVDAPTHVLEFAHGAEQPEATLEDAGALRLQTCAVNPVTGDLAVVDAGRVGEPGGIAVFAGAKGMPHTYRSTGLTDLFFCAYDAHGNLFVDGLDEKAAFRLVELPHGSRKVQRVDVDQSVGFPGALSWDGKYLALGDRLYQGEHKTAIYQIAVSGSGGNVKGTTVLGGSCDLSGFATPKLGSGKGNPQAMRVVAPDLCENTVRLYAYPNGGAPIRSFGTFQYPFAAAVSPASH